MIEENKILNPLNIFRQAYEYVCLRERSLRRFFICNFLFCIFFNLLEGGLSNPLSLVLALGYYVFWCVFFRNYYHKKPYFSLSKILAGAVPSSKMFFIMFVLVFILLLLPFVPLLMGFNDVYLIFFEKYMAALQSPQTSVFNMFVFLSIFLVISPVVFVCPYMAWISALQGLTGSIKKVFKKTKGNYFSFLLLMSVAQLPSSLACSVDTLLECHGFFACVFCSFYLVYMNVVFAKVYDYFYPMNAR